MKRNSCNLLFGLSLTLVTLGCHNPSNKTSGETNPSLVHASQESETTQTERKISKVVFVGMQNACDCTRERIEAGWKTLQNILGTPNKLLTERLQIDTEEEKVQLYRKQKPILALPALYFVDDKDMVVDLLQGEVKETQIAAVLMAQGITP